MTPPRYLDKDAKDFWKRHADQCIKIGTLNERTADSFALLCRLWSILQNTDPTETPQAGLRFVGNFKQYQPMAKMFGLLPAKAPVDKPTQSISEVIRNALQGKETEDDSEG